METLSIIVIVVIMAIFLGLVGLKLYSNIKLKGLRQTAIDLICEAEKAYDKGKNNEKFKMVLDGVLNALPAPVRIFLNESTIEYFVQSIFDSIKIALDTNTENKE
mgnify:FL=1|jgi:hypothetical protein